MILTLLLSAHRESEVLFMAKGKKKSRPIIDKDETKAERFIRVVTPRMGKAMKAIRVIGFCAGSVYEYTPKQIEQILSALTTSIETLSKQFSTKVSDKPTFDFED